MKREFSFTIAGGPGRTIEVEHMDVTRMGSVGTRGAPVPGVQINLEENHLNSTGNTTATTVLLELEELRRICTVLVTLGALKVQ